MSEIINMSRRDFLKTGAMFGGGLILGFSLPFHEKSAAAMLPGEPFMPNAFIRIGPDDTVTIIVNHSEMGQGVYTSLPMMVAEELECDWRKVRIEPAPVDPVYNNPAFGMQGTGGSTSVWTEWERLRKVGASARMMLVNAAAETWKVDPSSCKAEDGFVIHLPTKRRLSYGQLAEKAATMKPPKDVTLKQAKDFKLIGKPVKRLDTPDKTNGKAVFGFDVKVPGMLTALIARPPVFGGKVKNLSADKAKKVPGVRDVVQVDAGVAVVARDFWSANLGRDALEIVWDEGPNANISTDEMRKQYAELSKKPGTVANKKGDPESGLSKAAKKLSAEYEVPYLSHATMETLNCVVDPREDSCEIWTGTQAQTADRNAAARILGLKPEQVKLNTTYLGGGFGRRSNPYSDFVSEAAQVAKAVKKPVKVVRTREDDIKGGYYRPMWYDRISAGLDDKGNLVAWKHTIVGQSIITGTAFAERLMGRGIDRTSVEGAADIPYDMPNVLVDLHTPKIRVPVLWWRSVGHSHTAFVVESFMDEAAHAAGKDPYEFRRAMLKNHPRHLGVLDLAAEKAGWGKPVPRGRAQGIAVHESFGSFVAQVAEVSISPKGNVRVHKVVCAVDCGPYVNPGIIAAQMESGVVFGLTAALYGAITLKDGRVEQSNFHDYRMLRINEMPEVETHIVQSKEKQGGIGEPGVPPIAPAVGNAIFALTGKRVRRLPINTEELKKT